MSGFAEVYVKCLEEQAKLLQAQIKMLKAIPKQEAALDKKAKKLKRKRAPKDPDAPKKPPSAYQIYFMEAIVPYKAQHPDMTQRDIMVSASGACTALCYVSFFTNRFCLCRAICSPLSASSGLCSAPPRSRCVPCRALCPSHTIASSVLYLLFLIVPACCVALHGCFCRPQS
jgi:hypothetical protein